MFFNKSEQSNSLTDQAIKSTQRAANEMVDGLAGTVQDIRHQAGPMLDRATDRVSTLAHRGIESARSTSQHLRDKALHASDRTVNYIKDEPVKAALIAVAAGAALIAVVSLLSGSRNRR
jgi:ElaB/YqjD/DUF883 family membrane-anchored ribosome-binding protein